MNPSLKAIEKGQIMQQELEEGRRSLETFLITLQMLIYTVHLGRVLSVLLDILPRLSSFLSFY